MDIKALCNDIIESTLICNMPKNLPELVEQYNNILQDIFNKYAPVHKCTITMHPQAPCYNESIYNEKQLRRKLEQTLAKNKIRNW